MKALKNLIIVTAIGASASLLAQAPFAPKEAMPTDNGIPSVSTSQAKSLYESRSATFVDVGKNASVRIPGSRELSANLTEKEISAILPDKSAKIVIYGDADNRRDEGLMAEQLKKLGYTNVMEYPAGLEEWIMTGNPGEE